ncbi:uncharacterized protein LOC129808537 [Phlebotomus papatasi]|uniref:uncharacterized protein LOC129808537 n=1 Tax=Phlebotomus papatasi TaxID=29031 RepID=UPI0024832F5A|nr:uncharacterized protein LOC129808537 [Phlebotomus papatasi]
MTLLGKRNTLKGHLTRLEDYVRRVGRDEASFTATDIYMKLTTLEGIKAQIEVLHEDMLRSGVDEDQENEHHQTFLERLNSVESFLKNVLGRRDVEEDEVEVDEDDDNGEGQSSHSPIPKDNHLDSKQSASNSLDLSSIEKALATLLQHQVNAELRSQTVIEKLGQAVTTSIQPIHDSESLGSSKSKLPNIEIPKFSGNYVDWPPFRDMFINIVHLDRKLSDVQRLHYLVTNVDVNAKKMIKTLKITNANYRVAWDVLSNHFEDQASVIHEHIKDFCELLPISNPTKANFTELVVTAKSILDALDALEVTSRDPWVIYLLLDKLDHETKVLWSREIQNSTPTLPTFMTFLQSRMKSIERYQPCPSKPTTNQNKPSSTPISKFNRNSSTVLATPSQSECIACDQSGHPIFKCPTFLKMDSADRLELIRKFNRCRKCLTQNHQTRDCTFYSCRKCEGHHNTLLHGSFGPSRPDLRTPTETIRDQTQNPSKSTVATTTDKSEEQPPIPSPPTDQPNDNAVITSTTSTQSRKRVFLETAIVRILDKYGVSHQCRALLYSGAQVNLLSQSFFQKLKLPKSMSNTFIGRVVEGGSTSRFQTDCNIQSQDGETHFTMTCQIVPSVLQQKLPNWEVNQQEIPIPSGIELADPTWHFPQVIDLLIGNEFYNEIYTDRILRLGSGFPVMKDSCFGWILSGPYTTTKPNQPIVCVATTLASIDSSLKGFWEVEEIDSPHIKAPDHEIVENIFQTTTSRDSTGRFIVQVPFKPTLVRLHDNLPNATRQLLHLEKRLASKPDLRQLYHAAMQENLDLEFFEEVPPHEVNKPSFYMPHHCVTKHSPTGPKIRIVMNASSKSQTGLSLNDVAMTTDFWPHM